MPRSAWRTVELDVPHRKFKTPRVVDQRVELSDYNGPLRQLLIRDLGHDQPTILLTNDRTSSLKAIITRYAQRMLIENGLADSVAFFHLDALSSAVALNVDFDVLLTVIASAIYRRFSQPLRGYERAQAGTCQEMRQWVVEFSVGAPSAARVLGGLIQTSVGRAGGCGRPAWKRSGWVAYAAARTTARSATRSSSSP